MRKAEYAYPKMKAASSYQKTLARKLEELKLLGAPLELKEYTGRPPAWSVEAGGWNGTELKNLNSLLVVIKGAGKNGRVAASTYVTKEFYYQTIKISDRADADVMQGCVDQLLEHVNEYVREEADRRTLRESNRRNKAKG